MDKIIEVNDITKTYEYYKKKSGLKGTLKNFFSREKLYKEAVKELSFSLEEGEIVGLIGPNGSGKTTTIKMLSGILKPDNGKISILGFEPFLKENSYKKQFSLVMAQKNQLWWDLPAIESLILNSYIYEIDKSIFSESLDELVSMLEVEDLLNVQVRRLSLGERMKFELIAALIHKPKVIFLDEPTIGLDFVTQHKVREFLKDYNRKSKTTIIITSHYMQDIEDLCKRIIVINKGSLIYDGLINKLKELEKDKIVNISFTEEIDEEMIKSFESCGKILSTDRYTLSVSINKDIIKEFVKNLIDDYQINDFSFEDIPLEDSIISMYR